MATLATNPIAHQPQPRLPRPVVPFTKRPGNRERHGGERLMPFHLGALALVEINAVRHDLDGAGFGLIPQPLTLLERIEDAIGTLINLQIQPPTGDLALGDGAWGEVDAARRALDDAAKIHQMLSEDEVRQVCTRQAIRLAVVIHRHFTECGE